MQTIRFRLHLTQMIPRRAQTMKIKKNWEGMMMNRAEFMKILRSELRRLPEDERNSALEYYEE